MHERSIFMEALDVCDPREREAHVLRACNGDEALRVRVEALLHSHKAAEGFVLDRMPAVDAAATADMAPSLERLGTTIGPYKLMEQIGEGGMGVVYVAEQSHPVRRKVALKVIKPGMDTRQVVARFEAERQALALMDHPNIARVLDAGATESGHPYFVMELVRGIPVTDYCDREQCSIPERLDLFVLVCRAVQHAHQKGIIHRDLKPSNILVTVIDGAAVPKVIDFGVAKATGASLTDRTIYTAFQQMIGTPLYTSPEQADISGMDVDTRSDVYALGVLLYELLTGTTPIDRDTLGKAAYAEVRRLILEQEPPTPSTRLSSLGGMSATVAANRQADARQLGHAVRGELDWIVMKALEKDRRRRYETANDFAADVMRYLTDQPVEACPPSARYRFHKFALRNKAALTTSALVVAALFIGTAVSTWQAVRATQAGSQARASERQARANLKKAREAVDQMLVRVAGQLADVPHMEQLRRELLADSLKFYEGFLQEHSTDPEVRFETGLAYVEFGKIQKMLGEVRLAEQAFLQAIRIFQELADRAPDNRVYCFNLAQSHNEVGNLEEEKRGHLSEAEGAYRRALAITRKLDADFPNQYRGWIAGRLNNIGNILNEKGQLAEAESVHREALAIRLELDPNNGVLSESYTNLGVVLFRAGRAEEAEQYYRQSLEIEQRTATASSRLAGDHLNLGESLAETGRFPEAQSNYRKALAICEKLAADFPDTPEYRDLLAGGHTNLGSLLGKIGRFAEAETEYRETLRLAEKLADDFPGTPSYRDRLADGHHNLGALLLDTDRLTEAQSAYRRAQDIYEKLARELPGTPDYRYKVGENLGGLGLVLLDIGQRSEAKKLIRASLASAEKLVSDFPDVKPYRQSLALAHGHLGMVQYRGGDWNAAIASLNKEFEFNSEHEDDGAQFVLAMAHWKLGDKEQAGKSYDNAAQWMDKKEPFNQRHRRFRTEARQLMKAN